MSTGNLCHGWSGDFWWGRRLCILQDASLRLQNANATIIQSVLWFFETKIRHLWCLQKYKKISNGYIGSRCVDTHLSWLVYLSSVQASLTFDIYPTHYGCKCIRLPILLDDSAEADNPVPSLWLWSLKMDFDASVRDVCTNLRNANCQNQFHEYTLA